MGEKIVRGVLERDEEKDMNSGALMQFSSDEKRMQFEKIARFEAMGVADEETCKVLGLTGEQLGQIRGDKRYLVIYGEICEEKLEKIDTFNRGWDAVEEKALERVLMKLEYGGDPEFALKAATLANRATRRPSNTKTLDASSSGQRASINLNQTFIMKLNENGITPKTIENVKAKSQDFMGAHNVEKMLTAPKNDSEGVVLDEFPIQKEEVA